MNLQTLSTILNLEENKFIDFKFESVSLKQTRISYDKKNVICFKGNRENVGTFLMYAILEANIGVSNLDFYLEYPQDNLIIFTLSEKQYESIVKSIEKETKKKKREIFSKKVEKVDNPIKIIDSPCLENKSKKKNTKKSKDDKTLSDTQLMFDVYA